MKMGNLLGAGSGWLQEEHRLIGHAVSIPPVCVAPARTHDSLDSL